MKSHILFLVVLCSVAFVFSQESNQEQISDLNVGDSDLTTPEEHSSLTRQKRTLFLKKKLLGAGAIGFGLGFGVGALKGYKYGNRGYGGNGVYGGYGYESHAGDGGYGGNGGYEGYGGYGGYGGYSRPSYSNYYRNSYPSYTQKSYWKRPTYYYGYPSESGWSGYNNNYANNNANSWSASGSLGPISGGISASHASANTNTGAGWYGGQEYNNGGYYY